MDRAHDAFGAFVALAEPAAGVAGPLEGVRVAVKDSICVAGLPYTAGVPRFAGRVATHDAPAVRLLRNAGALIAGVTATDAGGLGVTTPRVVNPAAPEAIAGGSSGGSAAAVAAGLVDAALGTDTGGSVRIPAACCGIFGFKPSHSRVPGGGVWPLAPDLEDIGVMASRLDVLEAVTLVLLESAPAPRASRSLVIGVDWERVSSCDGEVVASFRESMRHLEGAGCTLRDVRLPDREETSEAHGAIAMWSAAEVYREAWNEGDKAGLGRTIWRALEAGEQLTAAMLVAAHASRKALGVIWELAIRDVDLIANPTLPVPVPLRGARRVWLNGAEVPMVLALTAETALANLFGAPAIALPALHERESVQLIAAAGRDEGLLADAARIHAMLGAT